MSQEHLSREEMLAFTHGKLDERNKAKAAAHLQSCGACHQQQTQMAMAAMMQKMQDIAKQNQQWECADPFWSAPYPHGLVTRPPSADDIRAWEAERKLRLPATLARALTTQNGGCVRGSGIVFYPLNEIMPLSEPKWEHVHGDFAFTRTKLLLVGYEDNVPASIILDYSDGPEPVVLYLWHDLGDELRERGDNFDTWLAARQAAL